MSLGCFIAKDSSQLFVFEKPSYLEEIDGIPALVTKDIGISKFSSPILPS